MKYQLCFAFPLALAVSFSTQSVQAEARIDWMRKIYGDGRHNAFTDLLKWKGKYYLCFRHGAGHLSMDGEIRVMRSDDLADWVPCGTLRTDGDDRDPHLVATDNELRVYFGTWNVRFGPGHQPAGRGLVRSHFSATNDGKKWLPVKGVYLPGMWLWRVIYHEGYFFSVAYTAVRPRPATRVARLLRSKDGLDWSEVATITEDRVPTESAMWFLPDGRMWVFTRMEDKVNEAFRFHSDTSLERWEGASLGAIIHSPAVAQMGERLFIAGRGKEDSRWVTRIWELIDDRAVPVITLPSGGDTAYPGLVADGDDALLVSWYSQHERDKEPGSSKHTASIYLARIVLE